MRRIHMPILLHNVDKVPASTFVALFTLEGICRGLLVTIVPLKAAQLLGGALNVSLLYLATSLFGLGASMAVPLLIHRFKRRWVLSFGAAAYIAASAFYASGTPVTLVLGLSCFLVGAAALEVTLNLYMLDHVPRRQLPRFEPMRMFFAAVTFSVGPWLGVKLHYDVLPDLTFYIVGIMAAVFCAYFWYLRMQDDPGVAAAKKPPPNPLRYMPRFFAQPRLALAWALAFGRNGWWLMFMVYTPIFVTEAGYSPELGGIIVSLGVAPMVLMPLWAKVSAKHGIRLLLLIGYVSGGLLSVAAGIAAGEPLLAIVLLCLSAFGATVIDGAGNVPFLRAVHPYERGEMTSVFITYRHGASLVGPGVFAALLSFFALPAVFVLGGVGLSSMALLSLYIPKRM